MKFSDKKMIELFVRLGRETIKAVSRAVKRVTHYAYITRVNDTFRNRPCVDVFQLPMCFSSRCEQACDEDSFRFILCLQSGDNSSLLEKIEVIPKDCQSVMVHT